MLRRPIYGNQDPLAEKPLVERLVESLDRVVRERATAKLPVPSAPKVTLESDPLEALEDEGPELATPISRLTSLPPVETARSAYATGTPTVKLSHLPYGGMASPTQPRYRMRCMPAPGVTFKTQRRLELLVRLENAGIPDSEASSMLSISVPRVRQLKRSKDYLRARIKITHGLILDQDLALAQIAEQRRDILREMLPPALQVIANVVSTRPTCFAEQKLQVSVAQDILDREGTFAKISRSEVKPVDHFDWESTDASASQIVHLMRASSMGDGEIRVSIAEARTAKLLEISKAFTAGSNISPEEAVAAAKLLDSASLESGADSPTPAPPEGWASPKSVRR